MKILRPAIYVRVSTADQNPDMQVRELRVYCDARQHDPLRTIGLSGWAPLQEFIDHGVSGAKDSRPALDRLMDAVRRRKVDVVVVWKFDRFARSTRHLLEALAEFEALGVQFISLHDHIDTTTAMGKLFFTITAAFAEFERAQTTERINAGIAAARKRGVRLGQPPRYPKNGEMAVKVLKLRYPPRIDGKRQEPASWGQISRQLGITVPMARRLAAKP